MNFYEKIGIIKEKAYSCEVVDKIKSSICLENEHIVLYGAGIAGEAIYDICKTIGITINAICDTFRAGLFFKNEYTIISPKELINSYKDSIIMICSVGSCNEIHDYLLKMGFCETQIILCPIKHNAFSSIQIIEPHLIDYKRTYDLLEDEKSKELVIDRLELFILDKELNINTESDIYYEKGIIELDENEVFVDCGAYNGDSAQKFIAKTDGKYKSIHTFEPDEQLFEDSKIRLCGYHDVFINNCGVWNEETTLYFRRMESDPAGSKISEAGNISVNVTSLDVYFETYNYEDLPTFIKMDIEGSERQALIGAKKIIKQKKPKLAICAYHKVDDLYVLPQTILSIREDYRFFLRQYENGEYDTVLYAI